jgi:hypothetical protein
MENSRQAGRPSGWSGIDARRNKFVFLQFLRCRSGEGESRLVARWRCGNTLPNGYVSGCE